MRGKHLFAVIYLLGSSVLAFQALGHRGGLPAESDVAAVTSAALQECASGNATANSDRHDTQVNDAKRDSASADIGCESPR